MMDTSLSNIRCPSGPYRDVSIRHKYGLPASIAACRHNTRREKATSKNQGGVITGRKHQDTGASVSTKQQRRGAR